MTEIEQTLVFLIVCIPLGVLLYYLPQLFARFVAPPCFNRLYHSIYSMADSLKAFAETAKSDEPHVADHGCEVHLMPAYDSLEFLDALTTIRFYDLAGDDPDWPLPTNNDECELDQHIATLLEDEGLL